MGLNRWLGCIENPRTGAESRGIGVSVKVGRPAEVLVVGAGPAGLQAAIAAARNGHRVTVCERESHAGGQVHLAASVPNRAEFGDLVRNQVAEATRLGVSISYGVDVTAAEIAARNPDHTVIATGATPARPWWAPPEADRIVDIRAVLRGDVDPSGAVVVIDEIGFHHATSVAELLADRGCDVEIVTPGMVVGQDLGITLDLENWWIRATAKGIVQSIELVAQGFEVTHAATATSGAAGTLHLLHHPTGQMQTRTPDWVVLAIPADPAEALYLEVRDKGRVVSRVGDCIAPRRAHAAVIEGERVGAQLGHAGVRR